MKLLEVRDLKVHFPVRRGVLGQPREFVRAVDGVDFDIAPGETVGLVGESGCGKTTLGRAVVRLVKPSAGRVLFEGEDITDMKGSDLRARRKKFQLIFQDPYTSLDPRMSAGEIIGEGLDIHRLTPTKAERARRIEQLLEDVGLDTAHAARRPQEFSGGQRQRLGIARALAVRPKLIVCDEPVSALDVSIQAQIVNLLRDLQQEHGVAYLFIAHDLAVVEHLSSRILVMYLGRVVESGPAKAVSRSPRHPYTQALFSAIPVLTKFNGVEGRKRIVLPDDLPSPIHLPSGCPFHPRCPVAEARCKTEVPVLRDLAPGHKAACHIASY